MKSLSFEIRRDKTEYCKKKIEIYIYIYIYIYICFYLFSKSILKSLFAFAEAKRQELMMAWRRRVYSVRVPVSLTFFIVMASVFPPFLSLNPLHLFAIRVNFCYGYLQEWPLNGCANEYPKSPSQTKQLLTDVELNIIKLIFLWRKRKLFLRVIYPFQF